MRPKQIELADREAKYVRKTIESNTRFSETDLLGRGTLYVQYNEAFYLALAFVHDLESGLGGDEAPRKVASSVLNKLLDTYPEMYSHPDPYKR